MKKIIVWLVVSDVMVASLLVISCAPAIVEEEAEKVAPPVKEEEEVVVTEEEVVMTTEEDAAPLSVEEETTPPREEEITPTRTPTPSPTPTPEPSVDGLLSSDALTKNCVRSFPPGDFGSLGPAVGESATDFTLQDVDGNPFSLAGLLSEKPVVMVFGSFT